MTLTKPQQKALDALSCSQWKSAYESKIAMNTLEALASKGLVEKKKELGAMSFPLTGIKYRKLRIAPTRKIKRRKIKRRKK